MMLFLVHQFTRELQSRADVFNAQVVFSLYFLGGHASGPTTMETGVRVPQMTGLPWQMAG